MTPRQYNEIIRQAEVIEQHQQRLKIAKSIDDTRKEFVVSTNEQPFNGTLEANINYVYFLEKQLALTKINNH
jgi:hypothetical protein